MVSGVGLRILSKGNMPRPRISSGEEMDGGEDLVTTHPGRPYITYSENPPVVGVLSALSTLQITNAMRSKQ